MTHLRRVSSLACALLLLGSCANAPAEEPVVEQESPALRDDLRDLGCVMKAYMADVIASGNPINPYPTPESQQALDECCEAGGSAAGVMGCEPGSGSGSGSGTGSGSGSGGGGLPPAPDFGDALIDVSSTWAIPGLTDVLADHVVPMYLNEDCLLNCTGWQLVGSTVVFSATTTLEAWIGTRFAAAPAIRGISMFGLRLPGLSSLAQSAAIEGALATGSYYIQDGVIHLITGNTAPPTFEGGLWRLAGGAVFGFLAPALAAVGGDVIMRFFATRDEAVRSIATVVSMRGTPGFSRVPSPALVAKATQVLSRLPADGSTVPLSTLNDLIPQLTTDPTFRRFLDGTGAPMQVRRMTPADLAADPARAGAVAQSNGVDTILINADNLARGQHVPAASILHELSDTAWMRSITSSRTPTAAGLTIELRPEMKSWAQDLWARTGSYERTYFRSHVDPLGTMSDAALYDAFEKQSVTFLHEYNTHLTTLQWARANLSSAEMAGEEFLQMGNRMSGTAEQDYVGGWIIEQYGINPLVEDIVRHYPPPLSP